MSLATTVLAIEEEEMKALGTGASGKLGKNM